MGAYANGGIQQPLRTHVELLRKAPNGFTRHLEPNGAVQLGEELLLRAHVLTGDGEFVFLVFYCSILNQMCKSTYTYIVMVSFQ